MPEFKFFDRGFENTILLLPGWATDYRVFDPMHLEFNYLAPAGYPPFSFEKDLLEAMGRNSLKKLSILGWSMGSFMACDFLSGHSNIIDEIILVGVRQRYEKERIEDIKRYLGKNRRAFLAAFYRDCFARDESDASGWFRRTLLKTYLDEMDAEVLLEGLDYISQSSIEAGLFDGAKVTFINGAEDKIAPPEGMRKLKKALPKAEFIVMEKTGHLPFLNPSFGRIYNATRDR